MSRQSPNKKQKVDNNLPPYMDDKLLPAKPIHLLSRVEIQQASDDCKQCIEERLRNDFNMFKHTSPLAFKAGTGINDDLDGFKGPVTFHVPNLKTHRGIKVDLSKMKEIDGFDAEIVQSLAKWKRAMLKWYDIPVGNGLFCESFSIRKGYFGDVTHSSVVDQYDWEVHITREQRNIEFLKKYVNMVYSIIKDTQTMIRDKYPQLKQIEALPNEIHFVTAEELHKTWPNESIHGRENRAVEKWGAIFIIGMGWPMSDGSAPEEIRAPDYDDWNFNGDIIVKHPITGYRHELSSMGIRVDETSIVKQCEHRKMDDRLSNPYHKAIMNNTLPLSIGGGIGISRSLMLLLCTNHIGQVQVGLWADRHIQQAKDRGVDIIPGDVLPDKA